MPDSLPETLKYWRQTGKALNCAPMDRPTTTGAPWYELRDAIIGRDFATAAMLVQCHPNLTATLNGIGETVLHFLAIVWLHNQGADINCQNDFGIPAWFEVAQLGYRNLLLWFVPAGIDLNATNREGQGILSFLSSMGEDEMLEFIVNNIPHKK